MDDLSQYNPEGSTLRRAQWRMLDILKAIDAVCQRHGIDYWLDGGSMLGCARHQGFIPWDDDLDIAVFKGQYRAMLRYLEQELPPQFRLMHHSNTPQFPYTFAKVVDMNSIVEQDVAWSHRTGMEGLWVDIFPMTKGTGRLRAMVEPIYGRCLRHVRGFDDSRLSRALAYALFPAAWLLKVVADACLVFVSNDKYVNTYGQGNLSQQNRSRRRSWTLPVRRMPFENTSLPMPAHYDKILTAMYGDYMKLPPPEKRVVHLSNIQFLDS